MKRRYLRKLKALGHRIFPRRQKPWKIAVSVAIGIFIGVFPTIGIALFLTAGTLALLRLPQAPGILSSFIAIPPTLFPFFYPLGYWVGLHTVHPAPLQGFLIMDEMRTLSFGNFSQKFQILFGVAKEQFYAFLFGMTLVALATAILGGLIALWIATQRKTRRTLSY